MKIAGIIAASLALIASPVAASATPEQMQAVFKDAKIVCPAGLLKLDANVLTNFAKENSYTDDQLWLLASFCLAYNKGYGDGSGHPLTWGEE